MNVLAQVTIDALPPPTFSIVKDSTQPSIFKLHELTPFPRQGFEPFHDSPTSALPPQTNHCAADSFRARQNTMASVTSLDKDLRKLRLDKYTPEAANEARSWIEEALGEKLPSQDLLEGLKDGVALCK